MAPHLLALIWMLLPLLIGVQKYHEHGQQHQNKTCPSNHISKDDMYLGTEIPIALVKFIVIPVYSKTTTQQLWESSERGSSAVSLLLCIIYTFQSE